jgi:copper homeostasis protein
MTPPRKLLLELCIGSVEDAVIAERAGANRVELCSALMLGGLTPSAGMIQEAKAAVSIPVMAMIRPRGGGFLYSDYDFRVMQRDAAMAVEYGADGIVFGCLDKHGSIDVERTRQLVDLAGDRQTVFHRAFDVTPDPFAALEQLIDLGVTRVLTSGQEDSVYNGAQLIRQLIKHAGNRIEVLPGGGIDRFNLDDVLERTGCSQIHIAVPLQRHDPSVNKRPHVSFGGSLKPPEDLYPVADESLASHIAHRLNN